MKRIIVALLLLVAMAHACLAGDLPKLRVGYVPEPAHGLYYVAKEKGYFKDAGVDVELFQFGSAIEGIAALKAEKLDVGTLRHHCAAALHYQGERVYFHRRHDDRRTGHYHPSRKAGGAVR